MDDATEYYYEFFEIKITPLSQCLSSDTISILNNDEPVIILD